MAFGNLEEAGMDQRRFCYRAMLPAAVMGNYHQEWHLK
jgi:hypothetical protein